MVSKILELARINRRTLVINTEELFVDLERNIDTFIEIMLNNTSVTCLSIGDAGLARITPTNQIKLIDCATQIPNLNQFGLYKIGMNDTTAEHLASVINEGVTWQNLIISGNSLSDAAQITILNSLQCNTTIQRVDLDFNNGSEVVLPVLESVLKVNPTICQVWLRPHYETGQSSHPAITTALKRNKTIATSTNLTQKVNLIRAVLKERENRQLKTDKTTYPWSLCCTPTLFSLTTQTNTLRTSEKLQTLPRELIMKSVPTLDPSKWQYFAESGQGWLYTGPVIMPEVKQQLPKEFTVTNIYLFINGHNLEKPLSEAAIAILNDFKQQLPEPLTNNPNK